LRLPAAGMLCPYGNSLDSVTGSPKKSPMPWLKGRHTTTSRVPRKGVVDGCQPRAGHSMLCPYGNGLDGIPTRQTKRDSFRG
jgi:hypothetical protein